MNPSPTRALTAPRPATEPAGKLDREVLVRACVGLVDRYGTHRFTMRMLGEELGRSAMASYRHVAGKEELIALAADSVLAGIEVPDPGSGSPRERLRTLTRNAFLQMAGHPWVAPFLLTFGRPVPNGERVLAAMLEILSEVEPDPERARSGAGALRAYLIGWLAGSGLGRGPARSAESPSGPSAAATAHFDFGLEAMIAGILVSLS